MLKLKKFIILLFAVFTTSYALTLEAVEVQNLYQASVATNSQSSADRSIALKKALAAVLVKIAGQKSVLDNDIMKQSLPNYDIYLSQYGYKIQTLKSTNEVVNQKQLLLTARFDEKRITQLFQQANVPLWGALRPQMLIWLVDEQDYTRRIISNSSESELPAIVNGFSAQRGIPIMMPLMDLIDTTEIKVSEVWGRFSQPITAASNRYPAQVIAVVRLSNSSLQDGYTQDKRVVQVDNSPTDCGLLCTPQETEKSHYVLDWTLLDWQLSDENQTLGQQYQGVDQQVLLEQSLDDITALIYQRYASSSTNEHDFVIEVVNVDSLATHVEIFNFLSRLSAIKSVVLLSAQGNKRRFKLQLLGSKAALFASFGLDNKLTRVIEPISAYNNDTYSENNSDVNSTYKENATSENNDEHFAEDTDGAAKVNQENVIVPRFNWGG